MLIKNGDSLVIGRLSATEYAEAGFIAADADPDQKMHTVTHRKL